MEDQEKRISYGAGVTRKPSDFLCGDGELAECINLTSDGEELKVMVPLMEKTGMESKKLVFVHKLGNGTENYIYDNNTALYWNNNIDAIDNSTHNGKPLKSITAIGNTLIVSFDGEINYFLYSGHYTNIGDIPTPKVKFRMGMESGIDAENYTKGYSVVKTTGNPAGIIGYVGDDEDNPGLFFIKTDDEGGQTKYNDLVVGLYAKNQTTIKQKKGFCEPFCARVAIEMYDGTYTKMTNPVVLLPSVTRNSEAQNKHGEIALRTRYSLLYCWLDGDYSKWSDIVKDVVVFITDGVNIYDTNVDQPSHGTTQQPNAKILTEARYQVDDDYLTDGVAWNRVYPQYARNLLTQTFVQGQVWPNSGGTQENRRQFVLQERPKKEICDDIGSLSEYYRLCSLGIVGTSDFVGLADKISTHTLETLVTQEKLKYLEYYSHCPLKADYLYAYNNRLNMGKVVRGFFGGFEDFLPYDNQNSATYTAYVTIKTASGNIVISHDYTTQQLQGIYFFYPDPRATHVSIKKVSGGTTTWVCDQDLKEHPGLNGAYYLRQLLPTSEASEAPSESPTPTTNPSESLVNYLLTSEVNNPFVFLAHGYNKVGTGNMLGISALTMAYSQDQFGRTDLIVFTDEGVWGMQVDKTGLYENSHGVSRDVCVNPSSITQTDFSIFFVSKRGLMVIDEKGHVSCVSERMDGKAFATNGTPVEGQGLPSSISTLDQDISACSDSTTFHQFLLSASLRIAYDYIDSRLLLTNSSKGYCWVYSLKTGSFSKMPVPTIHNVVNAYPDYLLQNTTTYKVYTLYGKTREDEATTRQKGFLLTRPIKLGGVLTVASLRELVNVGYWEEGQNKSWVQTMVLISDDLVHWYESKSRFGAAAKYFRIALFVHLLPTERLSGTILKERAVRTGQLR